jgi:hypothetical protein
MSEQPSTYTCDECGYQAAELALVAAHLRTAHGITDAAEVGRLTQQDGQLILRSGDHETVFDLADWLADGLGGDAVAG